MELERSSLNDLRADRQGKLAKTGAALVNTGTVAATTFLDSFIGTAAGVVSMAFSPLFWEDELPWYTNLANAFVENFYSTNVTKGLQDLVKEKSPIYHSDAYMQNMDSGKW